MDGELDGAQAPCAGAEGVAQAASAQQVTDGGAGAEPPEAGFEAAIAERDARIAELEAQVAESARSAEAADELARQIEEVRAQAAADRAEYELALAGCRSVRAGRVLLAEHGGDVGALRQAEPWLFADGAAVSTGATGLPNAGAATDAGATVKRWRQIAGLDGEE
jgi:uncharacterized SAM-dependent methyltransferase